MSPVLLDSCTWIWLASDRRRLTSPAAEAIARALGLEGIVLSPLTPSIGVDSTTLPPGLDGDPADQIIVATARQLGAVIVTPDRRIRDYPHVPTIW
jgi:PIN domain nuclease of toxin-antitoxin system